MAGPSAEIVSGMKTQLTALLIVIFFAVTDMTALGIRLLQILPSILSAVGATVIVPVKDGPDARHAEVVNRDNYDKVALSYFRQAGFTGKRLIFKENLL